MTSQRSGVDPARDQNPHCVRYLEFFQIWMQEVVDPFLSGVRDPKIVQGVHAAIWEASDMFAESVLRDGNAKIPHEQYFIDLSRPFKAEDIWYYLLVRPHNRFVDEVVRTICNQVKKTHPEVVEGLRWSFYDSMTQAGQYDVSGSRADRAGRNIGDFIETHRAMDPNRPAAAGGPAPAL